MANTAAVAAILANGYVGFIAVRPSFRLGQGSETQCFQCFDNAGEVSNRLILRMIEPKSVTARFASPARGAAADVFDLPPE